MKQGRMKHATMRPAVFVLLALALSAPTLGNILSGSDSAVTAGEHLAAAVVISWVAVRLVGHLLDNYRSSSDNHQARRNQGH